MPALLAQLTFPSRVGRKTSAPEPQLLHSLTWAPKDAVLHYISASRRPSQMVLLLGLSLCLELDLVIVWLEDERM